MEIDCIDIAEIDRIDVMEIDWFDVLETDWIDLTQIHQTDLEIHRADPIETCRSDLKLTERFLAMSQSHWYLRPIYAYWIVVIALIHNKCVKLGTNWMMVIIIYGCT